MGSVICSLKRFNDSLGCFNRANMMLGRLEEEGNVNVEDIRPVLHTVLLELANVKTAMGRREEAIYNFKKCLEIKEMLWRKEEKNWVWIWGTGGGLCCSSEFEGGIAVWFEGVGIHKSGLGNNSEEFTHDRKLLGVIYSGLEEHVKALGSRMHCHGRF